MSTTRPASSREDIIGTLGARATQAILPDGFVNSNCTSSAASNFYEHWSVIPTLACEV